jgi:transcriptional regulator with XRE-family HTH domain
MTEQNQTDNVPMDSEEQKSFGAMLSVFLRKKDLSQAELANKSGVTASNISAICRGKRQIGYKLADRLAVALGLDEKEKASFVAYAKKPAWKGMDHLVFGPEAMINDWIMKELKSVGIDGAKIASVGAVTEKGNDDKRDAVIVLKNGTIWTVEIKIRELKE